MTEKILQKIEKYRRLQQNIESSLHMAIEGTNNLSLVNQQIDSENRQLTKDIQAEKEIAMDHKIEVNRLNDEQGKVDFEIERKRS